MTVIRGRKVIWILYVLLVVSVVTNVVLAYMLVRFTRKLLQFDEIFGLLQDDIATNVSYFEKLLNTPLFMASSEIEGAHKNMNLMSLRMDEYSLRIGEATGKKKQELSVSEKNEHPPIVID